MNKNWKINSKHTINDVVYKVIWCPCCSNKTLDNFYVCEECGWQDPEDVMTENDIPLQEYKELYYEIIKNNPDYRWIEGKNIKRKVSNTNEI